MRYFIILSFLISICAKSVSAQELVVGLSSNIVVSEEASRKTKGAESQNTTTLELPFFDDFSGRSVFPDPLKWADNYVFVNNNYSDKQITTGVATFDAIDSKGKLYETAISSGFEGDVLTSQPINLEYTVTDNVMLSFYYQAGGLGDMPEQNDTLTLQFLAPEENKWYSVWRARGGADDSFRQAFITIADQRYLKNGFRFRFKNYVTISPVTSDQSMIGNSDHWNLDYVLLDKNRDDNDTTYADVAFRTGIRSLLKNHESLPWNHFREIELQEMGAFIPIHYKNNDVIVRNITRNFEIWDVNSNTLVHSFTAGATNIEPQTNIDYNANLIYTFSSDNPDSSKFRIIATLKTDVFDPKGNDTLIYYQIFRNYIAFDDGTAEMGYGINGLGSRNAMVACRFTSYVPDTLRAVQICFNDSFRDANRRAFDLIVWDDNKGVPGNILYRGEEVMVEQAAKINGFYNYGIADGIPVDGVFYVGWKQRSETFLNAGLDVNTSQKGRQYYWLNGEWNQSQVYGSIMIRPVVGMPEKITSINDHLLPGKSVIRIAPNPAQDFITVTTDSEDDPGHTMITITDISGRELIRCMNTGPVNISSLRQGLYIVTASVSGRQAGHTRLIKAR
jgi:hypothetical protein